VGRQGLEEDLSTTDDDLQEGDANELQKQQTCSLNIVAKKTPFPFVSVRFKKKN
jgi:hypothetical protein